MISTSDQIKPISWDSIEKFCQYCDANNTDMPSEDIFYRVRTQEVIDKYREWKSNRTEEWLYNKIFLNNNHTVRVLQNNFPYYFEPGLVHYVVWLRPKRDKYEYTPRMGNELVKLVQKELINIYPHIETPKFVYFRNGIDLRTIPSIDHYHVIVKTT